MEKYPLAKKAYKINFDKIDEGYLASEEVCYAENEKKARSILLDRIRNSNWKLRYSDDEISYINIPVVRAKNYDKFHFEGQVLTRYEIEQILTARVRENVLQGILDDGNIKYCYIKKRSMFYKPNSCGYTDFKTKAGVYTKKEAVSHAIGCDEIGIEPINIDAHNKLISEEINDLKSRIL